MIEVKEAILRTTGARSMDKAEKWLRIFYRGGQYRRRDNRGDITLEEGFREEMGRTRKHAPMKVKIFPQKYEEDKCNVLLFFKEGEEPEGHVRLLGKIVGSIKVGEKYRPVLCRNCKGVT